MTIGSNLYEGEVCQAEANMQVCHKENTIARVANVIQVNIPAAAILTEETHILEAI